MSYNGAMSTSTRRTFLRSAPALAGDTRGRTWSEALTTLRARHGADLDAPAFRRGWERGQTYFRQTGQGAGLKKSA